MTSKHYTPGSPEIMTASGIAALIPGERAKSLGRRAQDLGLQAVETSMGRRYLKASVLPFLLKLQTEGKVPADAKLPEIPVPVVNAEGQVVEGAEASGGQTKVRRTRKSKLQVTRTHFKGKGDEGHLSEKGIRYLLQGVHSGVLSENDAARVILAHAN